MILPAGQHEGFINEWAKFDVGMCDEVHIYSKVDFAFSHRGHAIFYTLFINSNFDVGVALIKLNDGAR